MIGTEQPYSVKEPWMDSLTRDSLAPLHWVVMHNDPVTTMDFVVDTLVNEFGMAHDAAIEAMYRIHYTGLDKVAIMPLERAEFKVENIRRTARMQGFPLTCTIETDQ